MNQILTHMQRMSTVARILGSVGVISVAATTFVAGTALASATADLSVNPTAQRVTSTTITVSGTYRCTPVGSSNMGQISAILTQPAPGGSLFSNGGVVNVICDGTTRPYSVTTFGSVKNGLANYHVVLNAPTRENIVRDGILTVL